MVVSNPQITHVIFDLDGLLLDTETIYTKVNTEIMKNYDREYTMELKAKTTGMKMGDAIRVMLEHVCVFSSSDEWIFLKLYGASLITTILDTDPLSSATVLKIFATLTSERCVCADNKPGELYVKVSKFG